MIRDVVKNRFRNFCVLMAAVVMSCPLAGAVNDNVKDGRQTVGLHEQQVESVARTTKLIGFDGDALSHEERDSIYEEIKAFYYDQFRHAQDPDAPYFMFLSKDAEMMMGIGGVVRMRGWYDWGGAIPVSAFAPSLIPIPSDPTSDRQFGSTPAGTTLFLRVVGNNRLLGKYQLYVEANFNGYQQRGFMLKKAYAQVRDFTVGLASSTFSDPAALPPTVDAQGPTNQLSANSVLVRYMPTFGKFSFGVSVETPDVSVGANGTETATISPWIPDGAVLLQYEWKSGQHIRVAGIVRGLGYRNLLEQRNVRKAGWGIQLSSVARPYASLTTYFTFNCGAGYGSLCNDLIAVSNDLISDPERPGELYAPFSFGYCVGLQYYFLRNLFSTLQFSQTSYCPSKDVAPDSYKYGYCLTANIFWNPVERMQVGVEFDLGKRQNFSGDHKFARRIGALVQFSF